LNSVPDWFKHLFVVVDGMAGEEPGGRDGKLPENRIRRSY